MYVANIMTSCYIIVVFLVVFGWTNGENLEFDLCDEVYRFIRTGEVPGGGEAPNPIDITFCLRKLENTQKGECTFNTSTCARDCHVLGYVTDENGCEKSCECQSSGFLEEDIKFDPVDLPVILKNYGKLGKIIQEGASVGLKRWDEKRVQGRVKVPYVISTEMNDKARKSIADAISAYTDDTCIDFVERTTEKNYINIVSRGGCWSYVGRHGGRQDVSIGNGCEWKGVVQHEFMHALGFWHEQSRPDRDEHILVKLENVAKGKEHNFKKRVAINSLGSPYDIGSVMHYGGYSFTKNRQPTIVVKATNLPVRSQRNGLSQHDIDQLNAVYKCSVTPTTPSWSAWSVWGSCSVTCGGGEQTKSRVCKLNGQEQSSGCEGSKTQTQTCATNGCPTITTTTTTTRISTTPPTLGSWGTWKSWGSCSKSCGTGYRWRRRVCIGGHSGRGGCKGSAWQANKCNIQPCLPTTQPNLFSGVQWSSKHLICKYRTLLFGDFNGDGRQDFLCYHANHWTILYLATSSGQFPFKSWQRSLTTCKTFSGPNNLIAGDLNGDGRDDLLCQNVETGNIRTTFAASSGFESEVSWTGSFPSFCSGRFSKLSLIDVNGDGLNDLVCQTFVGIVRVMYNKFK